jgi:hypothetical protein
MIEHDWKNQYIREVKNLIYESIGRLPKDEQSEVVKTLAWSLFSEGLTENARIQLIGALNKLYEQALEIEKNQQNEPPS